ncbi:DEA(D/H)-box RNA helicase family protein isoform 1 [Hibiscus syriacus]|uniref:DEA(D/H)-box RNA helicase family protein isoform 1 n=1 Tax=Hibiscus syriacus TaxID=106335 RepID=A0A6A2YI26_HIBSY|nr:DEA(D/H)-box RNA helicase family protein isoform 1 [Hibiscus syriacus]
MGLKNRVEEDSYSMNEALLLATMSIIGLPVDVHLKDGSVYSGTFHTASVEKEYGIVLKKAKLTRKGRCATNVANGSVVETLVILAGDLVQVVAKGVPLPYDVVAEVYGKYKGSFISDKRWTNVGKGEDASGATIAERQVGDDRSLLLQDEYDQIFEVQVKENNKEVWYSVSSYESSAVDTLMPVKPVKEGKTGMTVKLLLSGTSEDAPVNDKLENQSRERRTATEIHEDPACCGVSTSSPVTDVSLESCHSSFAAPTPTATDIHHDPVCSGISTYTPAADVSPESCQGSFAAPTPINPPQNLESNKNSREFKLNPGAKVFSPSFATAISAASPMVPTIANVCYMPGNSPMIAVAGSQPDIGMGTFAAHSSAPSKFVSYGNITPATGVGVTQFSQHIVGHMGGRTQPLRYAGQYHPVQATPPAFLNPNSQAVMFGRLGQLVCVPVSHDLVQGAAALSPVPACSLTAHHVQFPKHQGSATGQAFQHCVPQPFIAGGQQPLAVPSHILFLQPHFPVNHPIQFPGSNGIFSAKLP